MTATMTQDVPAMDVDLYSPEMIADPWPTLARIRQAGPVVWNERGHWMSAQDRVCRYIFNHPEVLGAEPADLPAPAETLRLSAESFGPEHAGARALFDDGLAERRARLREAVRQVRAVGGPERAEVMPEREFADAAQPIDTQRSLCTHRLLSPPVTARG